MLLKQLIEEEIQCLEADINKNRTIWDLNESYKLNMLKAQKQVLEETLALYEKHK